MGDELVEVLPISEYGMFEAGVDEAVGISLEAFVYDLENADALSGGDVTHIDAHHFLGHIAFHPREGDALEVFVGC